MMAASVGLFALHHAKLTHKINPNTDVILATRLVAGEGDVRSVRSKRSMHRTHKSGLRKCTLTAGRSLLSMTASLQVSPFFS